MYRTAKIKAFILLGIFGLLFLQNSVPHFHHVHSQEKIGSQLYIAHNDHDHEHILSESISLHDYLHIISAHSHDLHSHEISVPLFKELKQKNSIDQTLVQLQKDVELLLLPLQQGKLWSLVNENPPSPFHPNCSQRGPPSLQV